MASKLTVATPVETATEEPRVSIVIPLKEEDGTGSHVDPYEHVTVNGETTLVRRGERVNVTIPVFEQLRNKFPTI